MPLIVVQREYDEPQQLDALQAREDAQSWCLEENGVTFLRTYFSLDRKRMACIYEAPDAEAVRRTQRVAGLSFTQVWAAQTFRSLTGASAVPSETGKSLIVLERSFPEPMGSAELAQMVDHGAGCFLANDIDFIDSYVSRDGRLTLCLFAAVDAESVRRANRTMQLPFARAWAATRHESPAH